MSSLSLRPLTPGAGGELAAMTFPAYRHLLSLEPQPRHPELGETRPVAPFGVVAYRDGRAVGLALAEAPAVDEADGGVAAEGQLLSVFVLPGQRRCGLATALVAAVEEEARRRGLRELGAVYTTGGAEIDAIERALARRGWNDPERCSLVVRFTPAAGLRAEVFGPALERFRAGLEIFPWSELDAGELEAMRRSNRERCWIEPALEPWQFDPAGLDASSVGARHRGRVVGWVLNHRVLPGAVRFSVSYMHPVLARRGKVVALYHASLERLAADSSCHRCTFTTPFSYPRMVAFARRVIAPIALAVGESRRVRCRLDAVPEQPIDPPVESVPATSDGHVHMGLMQGYRRLM